MTVTDSVWSARDTNPAEIEAALRGLLIERHAENSSYVPARVLNLVCIVDREWSGEIANRLRQVGRYHPSRTVVCAVEPRRSTLDAVATVASDVQPKSGEYALTRETVIVYLGPCHLESIDTIVDPLVITDLPTMVWSPHGHNAAVDALRQVAQVVLLDSVDEPDLDEALARPRELSQQLQVVDLAWLRTVPWRERIAGAFDPLQLRPQLRQISSVAITHHPESAVAGLLLLGWLASRLHWRPSKLVEQRGERLTGKLRAHASEVAISLEPTPQQVRGLASIRVETAAGMSLSFERGAGGLQTLRRDRKGREQRWTVLGASRGEGGILGEGIRRALATDRTYAPALEAAAAMAP
jgi:glucose-6-phosphate dehydrogenase assembly protein OpcA